MKHFNYLTLMKKHLSLLHKKGLKPRDTHLRIFFFSHCVYMQIRMFYYTTGTVPTHVHNQMKIIFQISNISSLLFNIRSESLNFVITTPQLGLGVLELEFLVHQAKVLTLEKRNFVCAIELPSSPDLNYFLAGEQEKVLYLLLCRIIFILCRP